MDRIAPNGITRRRQGENNLPDGRPNRARMMDDSGLELAHNHGMQMNSRDIPPGDERFAEWENGQDYDENLEYTINDGVDPDDLIKTMEPAQIEKFIPKRTFEVLAKVIPNLDNEKCTICLDQVKNAELLRSIPLCQHVFHAECLLNWLLVNEICPNCKNEVSLYTLKAYFDSLKASKSRKQKRDESPDARIPANSESNLGAPQLSNKPNVGDRPIPQNGPTGGVSTGQLHTITPTVRTQEPQPSNIGTIRRNGSFIEEDVLDDSPH